VRLGAKSPSFEIIFGPGLGVSCKLRLPIFGATIWAQGGLPILVSRQKKKCGPRRRLLCFRSRASIKSEEIFFLLSLAKRIRPKGLGKGRQERSNSGTLSAVTLLSGQQKHRLLGEESIVCHHTVVVSNADQRCSNGPRYMRQPSKRENSILSGPCRPLARDIQARWSACLCITQNGGLGN